MSQFDEWSHLDSWISPFGLIERLESGDWLGKVTLGTSEQDNLRYARLSEFYSSAAAAKSAVERTWRREHGK
jgi:hypothetical protein